ncbi:MAG: hypothetical protein J6A37_16560 [Oscillospiraceae bacterium]|nr:hypothetical protein [Oscillospiraceae bacterium]
MITYLIVSLVDLILGLLPDFNVEVFSVDSSVINLFLCAGYFLPMNTIAGLFSFGMSLTGLRILFAIILRIKSFIPGWGN